MYKNFYKNILHKLNYWDGKVCADFEGKLKRRRFKFQYTFIKLYRLVGTNFPDNPIVYIFFFTYINI